MDAAETIVLHHVIRVDEELQCPKRTCIMSLLEHELTLISCPEKRGLRTLEQIQRLATKIYDQFGEIDVSQCANFHSILLDTPLQHNTADMNILLILAAMQQTQIGWIWSSKDDVIRLCVQGSPTTVDILTDFWTRSLPMDTMHQLGRIMEREGQEVLFKPAHNQGVCPMVPAKIALSVMASRSALDQLSQFHTQHRAVIIKWDGRALWKGNLPHELPIQSIMTILQHTLSTFGSGMPCRSLYKGKQVHPNASVESLQTAHADQPILLFAVLGFRGGTGGTKQQQKAIQQSAILSAMLEAGYDAKWATTATETIVSKTSLAKMQTVTSMPQGSNRLQAIRQLCKDQSIVIPDATRPKSGYDPTGAPWKPKKKKSDDARINPQEFALISKFFLNQDDSEVQQLTEIRPNGTGLCLLSPS